MSNRLVVCFFYLFPSYLLAQSYEVLSAKKVMTTRGEKVRKGDDIPVDQNIHISEKGEIEVDIESAMHLRLGPGSYNLKKEAARLTSWYDTHLKLTNYLKKEGLIKCKFRYKTMAVPGSDRHYEMDRIEIDQKPLVRIKDDTTALTISWNNPDHRYEGKYLVIVRDFFNHGFIDVIEALGNRLTFFPGSYGHKYIYFSVLARNCRASLRYRLEIIDFPKKNYQEPDFTLKEKGS